MAPFIPTPLRNFARSVRRKLRLLANAGSDRHCPICERSFRSFAGAGYPSRKDALCINCGSLERHRLLWLFLQQRPGLMKMGATRLLHVAPEPCIAEKLREASGPGYLSADLMSDAMEQMDICDIHYPDASFDAIYCNHVLEHVADDRKAMREFRRVLRPHGWAIILVPVTTDRTFEDPTITDPKERLRLFGQEDHVRCYGPDYVDRLREAGFDVQVFLPSDLFPPEEISGYGLGEAAGEICMCTCPPPAVIEAPEHGLRTPGR
jgi:SAM-dependent methyltransferase